MTTRTLVCNSCEIEQPFELRFDPCSSCGRPLDVRYELPKAFKKIDPRELEIERGSIWRFWPLLPVSDASAAVTLGEGGTPMLKHERLNDFLGLPNLYLKNEAANPTWSFKDRLNSVNASVARESKNNKIVASSTGNHGASAAAYAASAGMQSVVLLPHGTPEVFAQMIAAYGGSPVLTDWNGRYSLMEYLVKQKGWFPSKSALPAPLTNPFGLEGYKSIAYEIAIGLGTAPDYVLIPVGSGDDIAGIYKGFSEFHALDLIEFMPALVSCEAEASAPVAEALKNKSNSVVQINNPRTIAISISEGIAGVHALRAVEKSAGFAATASDSEIHEAMRLIANAGFAAESSSCVGIAALIRAVRENRIERNSKIVVILTSAGIKWPAQLAKLGQFAVSIRPEPELLDAILHQEEEAMNNRTSAA